MKTNKNNAQIDEYLIENYYVPFSTLKTNIENEEKNRDYEFQSSMEEFYSSLKSLRKDGIYALKSKEAEKDKLIQNRYFYKLGLKSLYASKLKANKREIQREKIEYKYQIKEEKENIKEAKIKVRRDSKNALFKFASIKHNEGNCLNVFEDNIDDFESLYQAYKYLKELKDIDGLERKWALIIVDADTQIDRLKSTLKLEGCDEDKLTKEINELECKKEVAKTSLEKERKIVEKYAYILKMYSNLSLDSFSKEMIPLCSKMYVILSSYKLISLEKSKKNHLKEIENQGKLKKESLINEKDEAFKKFKTDQNYFDSMNSIEKEIKEAKRIKCANSKEEKKVKEVAIVFANKHYDEMIDKCIQKRKLLIESSKERLKNIKKGVSETHLIKAFFSNLSTENGHVEIYADFKSSNIENLPVKIELKVKKQKNVYTTQVDFKNGLYNGSEYLNNENDIRVLDKINTGERTQIKKSSISIWIDSNSIGMTDINFYEYEIEMTVEVFSNNVKLQKGMLLDQISKELAIVSIRPNILKKLKADTISNIEAISKDKYQNEDKYIEEYYSKEELVKDPSVIETSSMRLVLNISKKDSKSTKSLEKHDKVKHAISLFIIYLFLTVIAIIVIFPFYWMINTSLKTTEEIRSSLVPTFWPKTVTWSNYGPELFQRFDYGNYLLNTLVVGICSTLGVLITCILSAFAFARLKFKGKDTLFVMFLATMMIPGEMMVLTNYLTVSSFGWASIDASRFESYLAMIVPFLTSVFYIYLLRQNFMQVPDELYLAARVDGKTDWQFLWQIMVPSCKPTLITIAILELMGSWNAYVWPNLVASKKEYRLISNGLRSSFVALTGETEVGYQMAAAFYVVLPLLILFIIFRKYIMKGVGRAGIKG